KHLPVRNDPSQILTREVPHLRIVSDSLWYAANEAIQTRKKCLANPRGADHPSTGVPRDSRGPLMSVFFCGRCHAKMYQEGRGQGGYRCKNASRRICWNRASALAALVHER